MVCVKTPDDDPGEGSRIGAVCPRGHLLNGLTANTAKAARGLFARISCIASILAQEPRFAQDAGRGSAQCRPARFLS